MRLFRLAIKNILRKPFRSSAVATPIVLLVSLLIFTLSVNERIGSTVEKTVNRLGGDVMVVPAGALTAAQQFLVESKRSTFYMDRAVLDKIKSIEGIDEITYHIYLTTMPGLCCGVSEAQIITFNPDTDFVVSSWLKSTKGRKLERGEVIVGSTAYEEWQLLKIEDAAKILGKDFKIVGILEPTGTSFDNTVFVREDDIMESIKKGLPARQIDPNKISVIFIKLKEGYTPESISRLIEQEFLDVDAVPRGEIGRGLKNTLSDLNKVFTATVILTTIFSLWMIGAFFAAIVNERMREAGIIRALGAKKTHLFGIFISEAIIIAVIGSICGVSIGNVLNSVLSKKLLIISSLSGVGDIFGILKISAISFLSGIAICTAGTLAPIIKISRMEPYEAIRKGE